jgi:hypothetical protein
MHPSGTLHQDHDNLYDIEIVLRGAGGGGLEEPKIIGNRRRDSMVPRLAIRICILKVCF